MSALAEFLLARIAEDEALWSLAVEGGMAFIVPSGPIPTAVPPKGFSRRMLAECEAKRRIVELHQPGNDIVTADDDGSDVLALWDCRECRVYRGPCRTLRALALPYAEHPDMPKDPAHLER